MIKRKTKIKLSEITGWDIINWLATVSYWEANTSHDLSKSLVLMIGAHNGGLSLWLAKKGSKIICNDLDGLTNKEKENHKRYGLSHLIEYQSIDALDIPYDSYFNVVLFRSALGGIGRNNKIELQTRTIAQIYKSLKPKGELLFAENLPASPIHRFFRQHFGKWGTEWRYVSIEEIKEFFSIFSSFKYKTVGFLGTFGRNEWQRFILGLLDRLIFNYVTPQSWRYVIIGIAIK